MNADFEKLASRASFAALAVAPPGGKEYELLYLEDSPDREACQALSSRGWEPVIVFGWIEGEGLRFECDKSMLVWPLGTVEPFVCTAALEFMAAVTQRDPGERAKAN